MEEGKTMIHEFLWFLLIYFVVTVTVLYNTIHVFGIEMSVLLLVHLVVGGMVYWYTAKRRYKGFYRRSGIKKDR